MAWMNDLGFRELVHYKPTPPYTSDPKGTDLDLISCPSNREMYDISPQNLSGDGLRSAICATKLIVKNWFFIGGTLSFECGSHTGNGGMEGKASDREASAAAACLV